MDLSSLSVNKRSQAWFITAVLLLAGLGSYKILGQLEDPEFTVKTAMVITTYTGATAEEVELEVTDPLELAIQEMAQVKNVSSCSRAGLSMITIDILPKHKADELDQIWDVLRKKVSDARPGLPP